ncbi:MAG: hypothetical protein R3A10_00565 [Caldilineaceae bacterium]
MGTVKGHLPDTAQARARLPILRHGRWSHRKHVRGWRSWAMAALPDDVTAGTELRLRIFMQNAGWRRRRHARSSPGP